MNVLLRRRHIAVRLRDDPTVGAGVQWGQGMVHVFADAFDRTWHRFWLRPQTMTPADVEQWAFVMLDARACNQLATRLGHMAGEKASQTPISG